MKRIAALLFLAAAAIAQTTTTPTLTITGPASPVPQGSQTTLQLALSNSAGTNLSGIEWTMSPAAGVTWGTPVISSGAAAVGKGIFGDLATGVFLAAGISNTTPAVVTDTPWVDGPVASIPVTVTAPVGQLQFSLASLVGGSVTSSAVPLAAGAPFTIQVTYSHCDYNQDGQVDYNDAIGVAQAVVGNTKCNSTFAAGCSMNSLISVITAGAGKACVL